MENNEAGKYRSKFNRLHEECEDICRCNAKFLDISVCVLWVLGVLPAPETPSTQRHLCEQLGQPKQTVNSTVAGL